MNRLLSILVTLFILFLVYLWINHLTGGTDQQDPANEAPAQTELTKEEDAPVDTHTDPVAEQTDPGESEGDSPDEEEQPSSPAVRIKSEPGPQSEAKPEEKPVTNVPLPAPRPPVTEHTGGKHLVICGNFLARANAEELVKKLKKLGYAQAEVVNFELSEYHTACAGRYSDVGEARKIAKRIKETHGIDTYVRLGN